MGRKRGIHKKNQRCRTKIDEITTLRVFRWLKHLEMTTDDRIPKEIAWREAVSTKKKRGRPRNICEGRARKFEGKNVVDWKQKTMYNPFP